MANSPRRSPSSALTARNPRAHSAPSSWPPNDEGATRVYQVPPELIAMARAWDQSSAAGTPTPLVPAPTPEMNAAVSAYTAPCSALRARSEVVVQELARELPIEGGSASSLAPPFRGQPLLRTCLIGMGLVLLVLLAYHAPSLFARL